MMSPSLEHVIDLHLWIICNFNLLMFLEIFVITTKRELWTHKIARILQLSRLKNENNATFTYLQIQWIFRPHTNCNNGKYHTSTAFKFFETLLSLGILKVTPLHSTSRTRLPTSWCSCMPRSRQIYATFIFKKIMSILHTQ